LKEAVKSARELISRHGHMGYGSRRALRVGTEFNDRLYKIYEMGGCDEISKMLDEFGHSRPYFYDKLNWFHNKYCSG